MNTHSGAWEDQQSVYRIGDAAGVHEFLAAAAHQSPDAVAIIEPRRRVTYGELDRLANGAANLLRASGVNRHDRVLIAMDNSVDFVACYFGILKAGAVAVPLPGGGQGDRLRVALQDCSPVACILDDATARSEGAELGAAPVKVWVSGRPVPGFPNLQTELAAASTDSLEFTGISLDLAAIVYTSGSTGTPRGVMLTHRNIIANTSSIVSYLELTSDDRVMCVLPFYYVYGLSLLHTHIAVGASIAIDNRFAFPNVVLQAMQEHRVTGFAGVPSTFAILLNRSAIGEMAFPDLRYVTQAGGGMAPAMISQWLERGPAVPFFVMYGATEASARLTFLPPADLRRKLGSIGRAIPNVEVLVVTDDGTEAAPGEVGEIVARGANISSGYWNDAVETAAKFGPNGYRTGDLGYADEEGFLFITGRRQDMIKVGAHRVGPKEIEDALCGHPAVIEAAVIGEPHDILGEVPVAFVAVRDTQAVDGDILRAFCRTKLAPHKVPVRFVFRDELPKLPGVGKIDKKVLRHA